ncbi:MAG: right-handed parallel beta-helix repeat-containing protein [Solirubrobacteraceae bacterium]
MKPTGVAQTIRHALFRTPWSFVAVATVVFLSIVAATAAAPGEAEAGTIYYVAVGGHDSNSGRSPSRPWRTVSRVDRAELGPGDEVLFHGGETFSDQTLMPGEGAGASGTAHHLIAFGSYGGGVATLTQGIWLGTDAQHPGGPRYLRFRNLALGPVRGFQGTGSHIALIGLQIADLIPPVAKQETGILTDGSYWSIVSNSIDRVGDSGMLLGARAEQAGDPAGGRFYTVRGNEIINVGLDRSLGYPTHGIYLKVANATVAHNRIVNFHDDGVSVRYRDATVVDNYIDGGQIGIAWYQYDQIPGLSSFVANWIGHTSEAGIFVCGVVEGCLRPIESFQIDGNIFRQMGGERMNLQPSVGRYSGGSR